MGNIEAHDFAPVRPDERKELNLSRKPTYKQYLKHLNGEVHEACLRELPYSIRDSISLYEIMKASFNALTELPPELPLRLPHLRYLDLSYNQLTSLPCSFGLLFHLQTLLLQHNQLRSLPDTFTRLVKLEKLDLSYNLLREMPECIGEMENLRMLNVSHNKLKCLPLSLGNSDKLQLLLASNNRLDSPPQSICDDGSAGTLQYLRKQFQADQAQNPPPPSVQLNEFPRQRSNQLHSPVSNPHSAHMQYIQEQTHTTNTPSRIKTPLLPPLGSSAYDAFELRDKILGLIYGAAIGDVVGLATRWMSPDQCAFHYNTDLLDFADIVQDQHRVPWRKGDWTSNFDIFMLLLDSIINWGGVVDELDFAKRLSCWNSRGFPELGDTAGITISSTIQQVVSEKDFTKSPHSVAEATLRRSRCTENGALLSDSESLKSSSSIVSSSESLASSIGPVRVHESSSCREFGTDNGAITRTVALGVPSFHDLGEVEENTVRICRATHADPRCLASCVFVSLLVAILLQGREPIETEAAAWRGAAERARDKALAYLADPRHKDDFLSYLQIGSVSQLRARQVGEMSHTFKPMGAAVLAVQWKGSYRELLMQLAMEGGDSNSNCCVGGALAGLRAGYSRLPREWLQGLRSKQVAWLNLRINHLLDMMGLP